MAAATSTVRTPDTISLQELLSVCYDLSKAAGDSIRRIFDSGDLGAIDKDVSGATGRGQLQTPPNASGGIDFGAIADPQTLADLESQRIIIGNLLRIYGPDLRIVGEEGELENTKGEGLLYREVRTDRFADEQFPEELKQLETKDITLWIDPLDGTREFTLNFVHYVTVLIGISYKKKAIGGVVHVPFIGGKYVQKDDPLNPTHKPAVPVDPAVPGQTVWGAVGVGVRGMPIVRVEDIPHDRRIVTTTRSHFSPSLQALLAEMKPQGVIRCGGAGSKGLLVLSGGADAYVYPQGGTKRWDTCAIDACVRAVGGRFTDQYGEDIVYDPDISHENDKGLLATLRDHDLFVLPKDAGNNNNQASAQKAHL